MYDCLMLLAGFECIRRQSLKNFFFITIDVKWMKYAGKFVEVITEATRNRDLNPSPQIPLQALK